MKLNSRLIVVISFFITFFGSSHASITIRNNTSNQKDFSVCIIQKASSNFYENEEQDIMNPDNGICVTISSSVKEIQLKTRIDNEKLRNDGQHYLYAVRKTSDEVGERVLRSKIKELDDETKPIMFVYGEATQDTQFAITNDDYSYYATQSN